MPYKPKPACPVCRRVNCTDPEHRRPKEPSGWHRGRRDPRRAGHSRAETQRRAAVVKAWRAAHGNVCPACGYRDRYPDGKPVKLTAEHLNPVALGGAEDGPLGVMCMRCQTRQGSAIGRAKRRGLL